MGVAAARHQRQVPGDAKLSIGQVLEVLHRDFSDLSPSKLRFLEEQGLITPERTPSGYRKFSQEHIERLRVILTLQRDHFLPLKVIAELLERVDSGQDPVIPGTSKRAFSSILAPQRILSRDELLRLTGAKASFLAEAISAGFIRAAEVFPQETVTQLRALLELNKRGLSPRHLRNVRIAAERDAELVQQAAAARGAKAGSPAAVDDALELAGLLETVRTAVVRQNVQSWLP